MNSSPEVEVFYTSTKWRKCRESFIEAKGNLCEKCLSKGIIESGSKAHPLEVHHKIRLNAQNLRNPEIALGWDNLIVLCERCHHEEHERRKNRRWKVENGRVVI